MLSNRASSRSSCCRGGRVLQGRSGHPGAIRTWSRAGGGAEPGCGTGGWWSASRTRAGTAAAALPPKDPYPRGNCSAVKVARLERSRVWPEVCLRASTGIGKGLSPGKGSGCAPAGSGVPAGAPGPAPSPPGLVLGLASSPGHSMTADEL